MCNPYKVCTERAGRVLHVGSGLLPATVTEQA